MSLPSAAANIVHCDRYAALASAGTTVGRLVQLLCGYLKSVEATTEQDRPDVFGFIMREEAEELPRGNWTAMVGK